MSTPRHEVIVVHAPPDPQPVVAVDPADLTPIVRAAYQQGRARAVTDEELLVAWPHATVIFIDVDTAIRVGTAEPWLPIGRGPDQPVVLLYGGRGDTSGEPSSIYHAAGLIGATHVLPAEPADNHAADAWADYLAALVRDHA